VDAVDVARRNLASGVSGGHPGTAGGGPGAGGYAGQLPPSVLSEPSSRCLWVGSSTVDDSTRHLLQPILLYRAGTDEARPVGADENNIHGWLFILRHFEDLAELRNFANSLQEISFKGEHLLVGERNDVQQPQPSPSKKGGKRGGAGRPRGSCKGGKGGSGGPGHASGGAGGGNIAV